MEPHGPLLLKLKLFLFFSFACIFWLLLFWFGESVCFFLLVLVFFEEGDREDMVLRGWERRRGSGRIGGMESVIIYCLKKLNQIEIG